MQPTRPMSCWQCGTVLSASGGRCPTCGAEQPDLAPRATAPGTSGTRGTPLVRPSRPVPLGSPERTARARAIPWVVLGVGLAAILFLGVLLAPRQKDAATAPSATPSPQIPLPAAPTDPNDLRLGDPGSVDPADILTRAKTRALVWTHDAVLVSMRAGPVMRGKVNLTNGGSVEYLFGKPTGEGFGAGARIAGKRFRITLAASGSTAEEVAAAPGRAALEPNCPLDEAARKAQAVGLPASLPVSVSYEFNEKRKKPVWRVTAVSDAAETRTLDGWTCAILVR